MKTAKGSPARVLKSFDLSYVGVVRAETKRPSTPDSACCEHDWSPASSVTKEETVLRTRRKDQVTQDQSDNGRRPSSQFEEVPTAVPARKYLGDSDGDSGIVSVCRHSSRVSSTSSADTDSSQETLSRKSREQLGHPGSIVNSTSKSPSQPNLASLANGPLKNDFVVRKQPKILAPLSLPPEINPTNPQLVRFDDSLHLSEQNIRRSCRKLFAALYAQKDMARNASTLPRQPLTAYSSQNPSWEAAVSKASVHTCQVHQPPPPVRRNLSCDNLPSSQPISKSASVQMRTKRPGNKLSLPHSPSEAEDMMRVYARPVSVIPDDATSLLDILLPKRSNDIPVFGDSPSMRTTTSPVLKDSFPKNCNGSVPKQNVSPKTCNGSTKRGDSLSENGNVRNYQPVDLLPKVRSSATQQSDLHSKVFNGSVSKPENAVHTKCTDAPQKDHSTAKSVTPQPKARSSDPSGWQNLRVMPVKNRYSVSDVESRVPINGTHYETLPRLASNSMPTSIASPTTILTTPARIVPTSTTMTTSMPTLDTNYPDFVTTRTTSSANQGDDVSVIRHSVVSGPGGTEVEYAMVDRAKKVRQRSAKDAAHVVSQPCLTSHNEPGLIPSRNQMHKSDFALYQGAESTSSETNSSTGSSKRSLMDRVHGMSRSARNALRRAFSMERIYRPQRQEKHDEEASVSSAQSGGSSRKRSSSLVKGMKIRMSSRANLKKKNANQQTIQTLRVESGSSPMWGGVYGADGQSNTDQTWGQLLQLNVDGSQVIELSRAQGKPFGFFVARGRVKDTKGVFVSRMQDEATQRHLAGLLDVGDEILEIEAVDVRGSDILEVNALMAKKRTLLLTVLPYICRKDI